MPKRSKNRAHTLIISDLHLGSMVSRPAVVLDFVKNFHFKKLILLGDVFESLNFNELGEDDWKLLSLFSELSKKKKVRWVIGNHDIGLTKFFSSLTGIKTYMHYTWHYNGKKYLAIHGHQFDNFLVNNAFLSFVLNKIYNFIQVVDFRDKRISRFIKRNSKGWLRASQKVAKRAMLYGRLRGADVIFCGHTHKAMKKTSKKIQYYNSGCWTDIPSTYITIDKDDISIHKHY